MLALHLSCSHCKPHAAQFGHLDAAAVVDGFPGHCQQLSSNSAINPFISWRSSRLMMSGTVARPLGVRSAISSSMVTFSTPLSLIISLHVAFISSLQPHSMSRVRSSSFSRSRSPLSISFWSMLDLMSSTLCWRCWGPGTFDIVSGVGAKLRTVVRWGCFRSTADTPERVALCGLDAFCSFCLFCGQAVGRASYVRYQRMLTAAVFSVCIKTAQPLTCWNLSSPSVLGCTPAYMQHKTTRYLVSMSRKNSGGRWRILLTSTGSLHQAFRTPNIVLL